MIHNCNSIYLSDIYNIFYRLTIYLRNFIQFFLSRRKGNALGGVKIDFRLKAFDFSLIHFLSMALPEERSED